MERAKATDYAKKIFALMTTAATLVIAMEVGRAIEAHHIESKTNDIPAQSQLNEEAQQNYSDAVGDISGETVLAVGGVIGVVMMKRKQARLSR